MLRDLDWVEWALISLLVIICVLAGWALVNQSQRFDQAVHEAQAQGCDVIGHARGNARLWFLHCQGQVRTIYLP